MANRRASPAQTTCNFAFTVTIQYITDSNNFGTEY